MINETKSITSLSLSDQVEKFILDQLRSQKLRPGDVLLEADLAEQLGVSKAPVREAIARLRVAGVLETKQGKGSLIRSRTPNSVHFATDTESPLFDENLFELRVTIECEAAALAATRRTAGDLAAIQAAMDAMEKAAASERIDADADVAFHRAVSSATHNPYMISILEFVNDKFTAFVFTAWDNSKTIGAGPTPAVREHKEILAAIRDGDSDAARKAALAHLQSLKQRLLMRKSQDGTGGGKASKPVSSRRRT
jgi:GntR family transcriptional repressor for pyruvate dehydrogenase complex